MIGNDHRLSLVYGYSGGCPVFIHLLVDGERAIERRLMVFVGS